MPDQNYSVPNLVEDTDHELLFKAAYALWLTEQGGGSGAGTVTSVALALPASLFSVSGSPVTGAGTLTGDLATQAANTVLSGPANGAAAAPTFRALVAADMAPAGSDQQIQYNNAGALGSSAGLTFSGGLLSVGIANAQRGMLILYDTLGSANGILQIHSNDGFKIDIEPAALTADRTIFLPDAQGTFVLNDNTVALTNKTIDGSNNTFTNIAISTAVSGLGTGIATALAINVGTAGAPVVLNGAGGTPSSLTLTNATGLPPAGVVGTAAILGANTFTALQTITQAAANAGILTSTGYSLTGSNATNMVDLAGTWNTSGVPTALKINITNTASGTGSKLMDLQIGGTSRFNVLCSGEVGIGTTNFADSIVGVDAIKFSNGTSSFGFNYNSNEPWMSFSNGTIVGFGGHISNADGVVFGAFTSNPLTLRTGNLPRIQIQTTGRVDFTNSINFTSVVATAPAIGIAASAGGELGLYSGSALRMQLTNGGNILLPGLPTSDPGVAGALYRTSGAVMISI